MADPFSIAASALGVASVCAGLGAKIIKGYEGLHNTDIEAMHSEVLSYERVFTEIVTVFSHAPPPLPIQQKSWKNIMAVINDSNKNLYQLSKTLPVHSSGESAKLGDRIKLWSQSTTVTTIRSRMSSYCEMLNCQITTMSLVEQWRSQASQFQLQQLLQEINRKVDRALNNGMVEPTPAITGNLESVLAERNRVEWMDSMNLITAACTTNYDPSLHSSTHEQSRTTDRLVQWYAEELHLNEDSELPEFEEDSTVDDIESDEESVLEEDGITGTHERSHKYLIQGLEEAIERELAAGLLVKAEKDLKRAMRARKMHQELFSVPFTSESTMQLKLAKIYHRQNTKKSLDQARTIVRDLIKAEKEQTEQKWNLYEFLATIYLDQGQYEVASGRFEASQRRLNQAVRYAMYAIEGREKSSGGVSKENKATLELLVKVARQSGDPVAAEAYRKVLEQYKHPVPRITCVVSRPSSPKSFIHENGTNGLELTQPVDTRERLVLEWLKRNGFDPDNVEYRFLVNADGCPPLALAVKQGEGSDMIEGLIRAGVDVDATDMNGDCALLLAADNDNIGALSIILENGCQSDITDRDGRTALHRAIRAENGPATAEILLQKQPNLLNRQCPRDGKTALHLAAELGNTNMTEFFIQNQADLNIIDRVGRTPLHVAVEAGSGREEVVKAFLGCSRSLELAITGELITLARSNRVTRGTKAAFQSIVPREGTLSAYTRQISGRSPILSSFPQDADRRSSSTTTRSTSSHSPKRSGIFSSFSIKRS